MFSSTRFRDLQVLKEIGDRFDREVAQPLLLDPSREKNLRNRYWYACYGMGSARKLIDGHNTKINKLCVARSAGGHFVRMRGCRGKKTKKNKESFERSIITSNQSNPLAC